METKQSVTTQALSISNEDAWKYIECMEEIKRRTIAVWMIIDRKVTTSFQATNIEFVCLQIRKILELIALASISANKEEYSKQHANFFKHWKAKKILESVGRINPFFYPIPQRQIIDPQSGEVKEVQLISEGFLTKEDFSVVYDSCSQALHASNPYGAPIQYSFFEKQIPQWMQKIKTLLNHHQVQLINKNNKRQALWVIMNAEEDGKAKGWIFQKIEPEIFMKE
jgi:hypothetical protein